MMVRLNLTQDEAKAVSILLETIVSSADGDRTHLRRALIKLDSAADFATPWRDLYMTEILRPARNAKLNAAAATLRGKIEAALNTMPEYIAGSFHFRRYGSKARWMWKQTGENGNPQTMRREDDLPE